MPKSSESELQGTSLWDRIMRSKVEQTETLPVCMASVRTMFWLAPGKLGRRKEVRYLRAHDTMCEGQRLGATQWH